MISEKFAYISQTDDFCSLPQSLMIKIIENVVPRLTRVTSVQVNQIENVPLEIPTTEERERNTVYEEDESDSSSDYD
jgi:hypothetical protein